LIDSPSFRNSDAFVLVYDGTRPNSLAQLEHFHRTIQNAESFRSEQGALAPVKIVAANKSDLPRIPEFPIQLGQRWASDRGCAFVETSAKEHINIKELLELAVRRVVKERQLRAQGVGKYAAPIYQNPLSDSYDDPYSEKALAYGASSRHSFSSRSSFWSRLRCW